MEALVHAFSYHLALDTLVLLREFPLNVFGEFAISRVEAVALLATNVRMQRPGVFGDHLGEFGVCGLVTSREMLRGLGDPGVVKDSLNRS